jgi:uncharacterized protein (TIGR00725 family)
MTRNIQVSVIGASRADGPILGLAEDVGRELALRGATVVCGGLTGVMEAVARGASEEGGTVIGIVPTTSRADANRYCTHVVATGIGYARNLAVVASGDAVIAVGGEWGTLSEIAHARQFGRPVVALTSWSVTGQAAMEGGPGIELAETAAEAVQTALRLIAERRGDGAARDEPPAAT